MKDKLIHLGSCSRPHGIKGGFSAHLINHHDSSLEAGSKVILRPKNKSSSISEDGEEFEVNSISFGNKCILYFSGVEDRNSVESMIPFEIYINRSELPEPEDGSYYLEDLVGLKVLDEKGVELGKVKTYFDNGAQTVLVVKKSKGTVELPFVEQFFPEVNIEEGHIVMIEPELI
ncbi:MAG: 16S rRNA processing protein RimM [Halobacteriovoraceae bacterium]|nr:16S rRNA processing protein RimM [Halobacteriovoraceae bacterium]|tara:strand:+ start:35010 stop:35531 length:522 start_codon:yes stop_codon:yes gene_type:complete